MGIPLPILCYLRELHQDARTTILIGPNHSESNEMSRAVQQGDPIFVHFFNAIINGALASLEPELGVEVGEIRIKSRAFADNIALITKSSHNCQSLLDHLVVKSRLHGLEISVGLDGKSASLRIDIVGKRKR